MYPTSDAFHQAIRDGMPQMPIAEFADCVLSAQDINVSDGGISFSELAIDGADFAPGGTPSSRLGLKIFNEDGAFSDYSFGGRFKAKMGVMTRQEFRQTGESIEPAVLPLRLPFRLGSAGVYGDVSVTVNGMGISGHDTAPYLRVNNTGVSDDTGWPVRSIVAYNGYVYALGDDRAYKVYRIDGYGLTAGVSPLDLSRMIRKTDEWVKYGYGIVYGYRDQYSTAPLAENSLTIYAGDTVMTYEFVPLGVFIAERPTYSSRKSVDIESYDLMTLLDEEYDEGTLTYPITLNRAVEVLCDKVGIPHGTISMTNGTRRLTAEPESFQDATYRDIISWIAEVCGCFAKMSRSGKLEMRWFTAVNYSVDESDYTECDRAYYRAAPVQRLVVINTGKNNDGKNLKVGSGRNTYYIRSNPIAEALL